MGALASTALVASLVASGCGSTDCSFTATCVGATVGGEGGVDVDVFDGGFDAPLDPCVNTPTDPKCLDETSALFVSTKADAAGADGTRAHPFKTITAGLAAVNATRKRVYVCEGDYLENVSVQTTVSILGGLACDWMGKGANPRLAPPKGVALSILKSNGVVVTDLNVEGSADAQLDGDSAIAVFVSESKAVLLRRVVGTAGAGTKGAAGADGDGSPNHTGGLAPRGVDTGTTAGADPPMCGTCTDGSLSTGGKGAASGALPLTGAAMPVVGTDNAGGTMANVCGDGKPGAPGVAAAAAAAAQAPGTLTATGWESPIVAKKGTNGNPGQGGGGGGSTSAFGGGSGGCGGCGGTGGGAAGNGGSSFALLSFDSDITLEDCALTAAAGGIGGKGGKGQDGQFRGGAGTGACAGGVGGHGGGGGGGGGGAGGHSAAIAHSGKPPTVTSSTLKHATEGASGDGGGGGASTGNPGKPGDNGAKGSPADTLQLL